MQIVIRSCKNLIRHDNSYKISSFLVRNRNLVVVIPFLTGKLVFL